MPRPAAAPLILAALLAGLAARPVPAAQRFPQPQFEVSYQIPQATEPSARANVLDQLDVAVLLAALALAAALTLRYRRRGPVLLLSIFSLAYFGFYRRGCVCPVGSLQNVAAALADPAAAIPATVLAFFVLPLLFALLFGRVFCAAVCPLGAIQDVVILKPLRLPRWLSRPLALLPHVYLALAVLLAATGAGFIVCRFDPFVAFFRLSGSMPMLLAGGALLALGVFVARPYCRFLCPYGVLLAWASRFARWRVTITPDECVKCRLCDTACPFDAIRSPADIPAGAAPSATRRRLAISLALAPLLLLVGIILGGLASPALARLHPDIQLADAVLNADVGLPDAASAETLIAFRAQDISPAALYRRAAAIQTRFRFGSQMAGAFLGLSIAAALIALSIRRPRSDWVPDPADCLSCGRCFAYCPKENQRRKHPGPAETANPGQS